MSAGAESVIRVSAGAESVIREITDLILADRRGTLARIETAVVRAVGEPMGSEPTVAEAIRGVTRENALYWLRSFGANPNARIPAKLSPQEIGVARETLRWGVERVVPFGYRAAQDVMWQEWMVASFEATQDPAILEPVLRRAAQSLEQFVTETVGSLLALLDGERESLNRDTQVRRLALVTRILSGADVTPAEASSELHYSLDGPHVAAIVWTDAQTADRAELRRCVDRLALVVGSPDRFVLEASASSTWLWLRMNRALSAAEAERATSEHPSVRIALGPTDQRFNGFRRTHDRAAETQRLMYEASTRRVVAYDDIAVVLVVAGDRRRFHEFRERVLGDLLSAPQELRETLRVYIREQYNLAATARVLFTHRNTVIARIRRAEQMLPRPISEQGLSIGLALEVTHWLG